MGSWIAQKGLVSGFRVRGLGFGTLGSGFRVQGLGFGAWSLGSRVFGSGFRALRFKVNG